MVFLQVVCIQAVCARVFLRGVCEGVCRALQKTKSEI